MWPIQAQASIIWINMVFYHLINMALVTIQHLLYHLDITYPLIWLHWISPKLLMLRKLSLYGIHGPILCWIEAFLTDQVQGVVVEGFRSPVGKVLSGVPQGIVLGPLLFLLHINDLPSVITSQIRLFADDCLIYGTAPSALVQTVRPCKGTWILWSDGVVHGA